GLADVATGKVVASADLSFGASCLLFTPDGQGLVSGQQGSGVQLWDGSLRQKRRDLSKDWKRCPVLALSRDGKALAVGDSGGEYRQVRLFDVAGGAEAPAEPGHARSLTHQAFAADGKTLLTADREEGIFWDGRTGERRRRL